MTTLAEVFDSLKYRIEVDEYGNRRYYNALGQLHREDGPAVETAYGHREWWQNGDLHRLDGPAITYTNGDKSWWLNGTPYTEQNYYAQLKALGFNT